jgi:DNA invertase Pin-like site-specific DNA recombinase
MTIPAAQYLRMSTEHQQYSLANQAAAIAVYADENGFLITRTYEDAGRSGLAIKNRPGLANLLRDVVTGRRRFKAVLVYDISRWGRFQDSDEAAHYEFLCKKAGIPVHYCAEQFVNDGSVTSFLLKAVKRGMAAEYSRELGVKVRAGQARLVAMGYRMGGRASYGLRRMLIDADGTQVRTLRSGEHKSLTTQRTVLVPGPPNEQEVVRKIFQIALAGKKSLAIARSLNARQIPYSSGNPWTLYNVLGVLHNSAYAGMNVWGTTSQRLSESTIRKTPDQWVRCDNAFTPIIDPATFGKVQDIFASGGMYSDQQLLDALRRLLEKRGSLSERILRHSRGVPSAHAYQWHFGSLNKAYQMIGYTPTFCSLSTPERRATSVALRNGFIRKIANSCPTVVRVAARNYKLRPHLIVDESIKVVPLILPTDTTLDGHLRWLCHPVPAERKYVTLACALDATNLRIRSSFVWAPGPMRRTFKTLKEMRNWGFRLSSPIAFARLARKAAQLKTAFTHVPAPGKGNWYCSSIHRLPRSAS